MADIDKDGDGKITREEISEHLEEGGSLTDVIDVAGEKSLSPEVVRWINENTSSGGLLAGAIGGVQDWVKSFVWGMFMPVFRGLVFLVTVGVAVVGFIFLGSDLTLKDTVSGIPGLADIPVLISELLIGAVAPTAQYILDSITSINQSMILAVTDQTGLAAAPLLALVQIVELGVLFYLLYAGVRVAGTLPIAGQLVAVADVTTRPFRAVLERIR